MLLPRRHPRFFLLLASLIVTALLLLLPRSPLAAFQSSASTGSPSRPIKSPVVYQGVSARVRRAERAYQKMLRGRDALIAKVGPSPRDVALFPPDKEPWPPYTVWDFFPPAFSCPHELERIGTLGDGGKWVCGLSQLQDKEDCIVYSVGSPADASFEAEVLARTRHCQLFVFDHTASSLPRALSAPASLPTTLGEFYSAWDVPSPENEHDYWDSRGTAQRTHFKPYRITGQDAPATADKPKSYTLETIMRQNGHTHIDILKIDLEGWEFDALTTFLLPNSDFTSQKPRAPPVSQMLLELHLWGGRDFSNLLSWWSVLERAGLRAVAREPNLVYQNYNRLQGAELAEYTFLNVAAPNIFISEDGTSPLSPPWTALQDPQVPDHELPSPLAPIHEDDQ
ncbi:methyltransferase domain-containing protein [Lactarius pseudohatsudake]|nr:methyltransferase domain-containing protein [Lactarius pseudohatsudake]